MSKSHKNGTAPGDYCADVLRLWAAYQVYGKDCVLSPDFYRKSRKEYSLLRTTFRYLLANLYDFDPSQAVEISALGLFDRIALSALSDVAAKMIKAYEQLDVCSVMTHLREYVQKKLRLSFFDPSKDRLYFDPANCFARLSAQTVLSITLNVLTRLVAPVLSYLADEIAESFPRTVGIKITSMHLEAFPKMIDPLTTEEKAWVTSLNKVRTSVQKGLDLLRAENKIQKWPDAQVILRLPKEINEGSDGSNLQKVIEKHSLEFLALFFGVKRVRLEMLDDSPPREAKLKVGKGKHAKNDEEILVSVIGLEEEKRCPRCLRLETLSLVPPALCARCFHVVKPKEI
eukprot:TRINITY_DN26059_c0_g1_i1.p1 TRINITY_DN26059_c0_g1~~TRINITY_DN26059_c0_g1_i1.p1  ORF type:complete len:354 (-),score=-8.43 TRINITY_DN26059_c0_g1_i1:52-1080(-)